MAAVRIDPFPSLNVAGKSDDDIIHHSLGPTDRHERQIVHRFTLKRANPAKNYAKNLNIGINQWWNHSLLLFGNSAFPCLDYHYCLFRRKKFSSRDLWIESLGKKFRLIILKTQFVNNFSIFGFLVFQVSDKNIDCFINCGVLLRWEGVNSDLDEVFEACAVGEQWVLTSAKFSPLFSFWHAMIVERGVPAEQVLNLLCFLFLSSQNP